MILKRKIHQEFVFLLHFCATLCYDYWTKLHKKNKVLQRKKSLNSIIQSVKVELMCFR